MNHQRCNQFDRLSGHVGQLLFVRLLLAFGSQRELGQAIGWPLPPLVLEAAKAPGGTNLDKLTVAVKNFD